MVLDGYNERQIQQFKNRAILLNGLAQQISSVIAVTTSRKAKYLPLEKLYPNIFGEQGESVLTDEQKIQVATARWKDFLGK